MVEKQTENLMKDLSSKYSNDHLQFFLVKNSAFNIDKVFEDV